VPVATRKHDPAFQVFWDILTEARRRGRPFEDARKVYTRRTGEPCPFLEIAPVPTAASIDFETCSEAEIGDVGAWAYAEHPSTRVLCLGYQLPGQPAKVWKAGDQFFPVDLFAHIHAGGPLQAWNVSFEEAIWTHVCTRMGWPTVPPEQWRDTMAKACAFALPAKLAKAAAAMGTAPKDDAGHRLMLTLCKPAKPTKSESDPWRRHTPEALDRLAAYCAQDVAAEGELDRALPDLTPFELQVFHATQAINRRGQMTDRDGARACMRMLEFAAADWGRRVSTATGGLITGDDLNSHAAIKEYAQARGCPLASTDKLAVAEALAREDLPSDVRTVLEARQAIGKASTAKVQKLLESVSADGRVRGGLVYHRATTGRWAENGLQRQNLPKHQVDNVDDCLADLATLDLDTFRMLWGDPYPAVSGCIRGLLTAAPGHHLIAADYAAIEARVVMWLAGDPGLALFGAGAKPYEEMASLIYGVPVSAIKKPSKERDVGKESFLGGGFGMGWSRFQSQCALKGIDLPDELAQAGINGYREKFPEVPRLWRGLETAALAAVRQPGTTTGYRLIKYKMKGAHLHCRLPSGRVIVYPFAEIRPTPTPWDPEVLRDSLTFMGEDTITKQWIRQTTWGGSLAENVTQAAARDLCALAILRCEERGLPVVSTAHDEVVSEIPESHPITLHEYEALVCELPAWAEGLPIKAEAWRGKRYRK
jgi:DNA polymerase